MGKPPGPQSGGRWGRACGRRSREPEGGGRSGEAPPRARQGDLPGEPQGRRSVRGAEAGGGAWKPCWRWAAEALPAAARDRDLTGGVAGKLRLRSGDQWGGSTERWPAGMRWRRETLSASARLKLDSGLTARGESEWGKFLMGPIGGEYMG
jgi:hypothetical protein